MRCKACNKLLHPRWPIDRELCAACFGAGSRKRDDPRGARVTEGRNMSFELDSDLARGKHNELLSHLGHVPDDPGVDNKS